MTANISGDGLAISAGQRLRIRIYSDDITKRRDGQRLQHPGLLQRHQRSSLG